MVITSVYNIPHGICVECGRPIIGKGKNALYCRPCALGRYSNVHHTTSTSVSLMARQIEALDASVVAGIATDRSNAIRMAIDCWIDHFRQPIDFTLREASP